MAPLPQSPPTSSLRTRTDPADGSRGRIRTRESGRASPAATPERTHLAIEVQVPQDGLLVSSEGKHGQRHLGWRFGGSRFLCFATWNLEKKESNIFPVRISWGMNHHLISKPKAAGSGVGTSGVFLSLGRPGTSEHPETRHGPVVSGPPRRGPSRSRVPGRQLASSGLAQGSWNSGAISAGCVLSGGGVQVDGGRGACRWISQVLAGSSEAA